MKPRIFIVEDDEGVRELLHTGAETAGGSEIETLLSVLMISGSADIEGIAEEALRPGAAGFLVKPFDVYSLLNRIREQREGEVRTESH